MRNFTCKRCGNHQLSYQSYIKSTIPVDINEGSISYQQPIIDHDDDMPVNQGYICRDCGCQVYYAGQWVATESQLRWFLTTSPDTLLEKEKEFEECLEERMRLMSERQEHYDEVYL